MTVAKVVQTGVAINNFGEQYWTAGGYKESTLIRLYGALLHAANKETEAARPSAGNRVLTSVDSIVSDRCW